MGKNYTNGQRQSIQSMPSTPPVSKHFQTFAAHRHFWEFFQRTGELVNFHHPIQQELLDAYRAEVDAYYHYNNNCAVCVVEFLNKVYRFYNEKMGL